MTKVFNGTTWENTTTDKLFQWRRNYAKRGVKPINVLLLGDSIPFGSGTAVGSTPDVNNYFTTMAVQLQRRLNDVPSYGNRPDEMQNPIGGSFNISSGGGYSVPTRLQGQGIADPWRVAAGTVTSISRGMGLRSLQINASSRLAFTAPSATGFLWWYEDGASNLGTPAVSVYAGDYSANRTGIQVDNYAMTMNTGLAQYTRTFSGILLPARGKWTVEFSPASGTPVMDMLYVIDNDLQQGVRVFNYSFGSMLSNNFAANATDANTAATASKSLQAFGSDGIDLIIMYIGANDYINSVNPATFQANLEAIIDKYRAAQTRPQAFLLVSHFARYDAVAPTYPWSQFKAAMKAVTATRTQTDYVDLESYFPTSQANDTDDDLVDTSGVHLTAAGQGIAAQIIADKLKNKVCN